MQKPTSNVLSFLFTSLFFCAPIGCCLYGLYYNPANTLGILLFMIPWSLFLFEAWVNDYASFVVTTDEIILSKPLRKKSFFTRKRNHSITILPHEWDALFYRKHSSKNGTSVQLYFRKERTVEYYFTASGFHQTVDEIQRHFPDKRYVAYDETIPNKLIKQLRKDFPNRVV